MASNTSKTARASVRAGQAGAAGGALSVLGEFKYVIPLNKGRHAYVRNLTNGKTVHLRTDSDAFAEEIRTLVGAGHGTKIRAELSAIVEGPDRALELLVDEGGHGAAYIATSARFGKLPQGWTAARSPKMAVPTRTRVAPSSIAVS